MTAPDSWEVRRALRARERMAKRRRDRERKLTAAREAVGSTIHPEQTPEGVAVTGLGSILMRGMLAALAAVAAFVVAGFLAAPASAGPPPPGCARIPILGLNPQIMKICDEPMHPDGSWVRGRQFTQPQFVGSTCDPAYEYRNSSGTWMCPPWAVDRTAAWEGPVDTYVLTADTVPPGEPGYIGCPDPECF